MFLIRPKSVTSAVPVRICGRACPQFVCILNARYRMKSPAKLSLCISGLAYTLLYPRTLEVLDDLGDLNLLASQSASGDDTSVDGTGRCLDATSLSKHTPTNTAHDTMHEKAAAAGLGP